MTSCFKLVKALRPKEHQPAPASFCEPCVYYGKNLDHAEREAEAAVSGCGLGFVPKDAGCMEMKTNNCSMRKK